jgi:pyruvate dehydrogenase E1 component beta subunit
MGIINRRGEQAAQHSQALQAIFTHLPGLKVIMPSTPYDAKGLLIARIEDDNPVVYVDDRWLYTFVGGIK